MNSCSSKPIEEHQGFRVGQRVYTLISTMGGSGENDDELTYPAGSPGLVTSIEDIGDIDGILVHVTIGEITNVFDETDGPLNRILSPEPIADQLVRTLMQDIASRSGVDLKKPPGWFQAKYDSALALLSQVNNNLRDNDIVRAIDDLAEIRTFARKQSQEMDDPKGDGSGESSRPPTGDDWNDLFAIIAPGEA